MARASIEVSGPGAERLAVELQAALGRVVGPDEDVSPVEVNRSAEFVVALIGLVFGGVATAKTIWDWWQGRRSAGVRVRIIFEDGSQVELGSGDGQALEVEMRRRLPPSQ